LGGGFIISTGTYGTVATFERAKATRKLARSGGLTARSDFRI
jgi:hypothetical protein